MPISGHINFKVLGIASSPESLATLHHATNFERVGLTYTTSGGGRLLWNYSNILVEKSTEFSKGVRQVLQGKLQSTQGNARAGCVVTDAKTGKNQFVPLSDNSLLQQLKNWIESSRSVTSSSLVFTASYATLSRALADALSAFDLHGPGVHATLPPPRRGYI